MLTRAHGPAASAGSFWAQHNVLAFLLLLLSHDAKGSPSSCTQLWSQAGPSFQSLLLLEHWAQLGITLLHQAPHSREHPCPEPSALLLFPRPVPPRFSSCCPRKGSWAGIPWQGLLPPTAERASNIKGVLGQCPHPWEPHNEAQKNVLGFKDFYLIFFLFVFIKKKAPKFYGFQEASEKLKCHFCTLGFKAVTKLAMEQTLSRTIAVFGLLAGRTESPRLGPRPRWLRVCGQSRARPRGRFPFPSAAPLRPLPGLL